MKHTGYSNTARQDRLHYRYIDNRIQDEKYMIRIQNTDNIIQDKE